MPVHNAFETGSTNPNSQQKSIVSKTYYEAKQQFRDDIYLNRTIAPRWSEDKANLIEVNLLYADYLRYAKQRGRSQYQKSKGHLSRAVNQLHQSGYLAGFESSVRQKDRHSDKTLTYWRWASLQELRQQWAEKGYGTGVEEVFWSQPIGSGRLPEGEEEVAVSATDEATADMEQQLAQRQDNRYSKDRFKDLQFD